jgi:hypothetical protein
MSTQPFYNLDEGNIISKDAMYVLSVVVNIESQTTTPIFLLTKLAKDTLSAFIQGSIRQRRKVAQDDVHGVGAHFLWKPFVFENRAE